MRNDAVVASRDMVYIAAPALFHVLSMAEILDSDTLNHNGNGSQWSWRRMGLAVMEQGDLFVSERSVGSRQCQLDDPVHSILFSLDIAHRAVNLLRRSLC